MSLFQVSAAEVIKDHELPLKKQKLNEYINSINHIPYNMQHASCIQQIYASLDPLYIHQCLQEFSSVNRHLSAFKPVVQNIKESKIRHANALGRFPTDPPVLQNPERVVPLSESERFERSYQPNVALAPPTPKKHRYGRNSEFITSNTEVKPTEKSESKSLINEKVSNHTEEKEKIETTVSVVQSTSNISKYNPEIELSTDTEDSASESSEKQLDFIKIEELLKSIDVSIREKVLDFIRIMSKEQERLVHENLIKDNKISDLEVRNSELLNELIELKAKRSENQVTENDNNHENKDGVNVNSSSIITSASSMCSETKINGEMKPSVIASVGEQKEGAIIIKTAPE